MIVREPENEYCSKLVHLMKYIKGTRNQPLILSANGSGILKWWIDGSFAVYPNMRGHTGGGLSMRLGFLIVSSTEHNLNTWSSTETEIVEVDDCTPAVPWSRYWLDAHKYDVFEIFLINTIRCYYFGKERQVFNQQAKEAHKNHILFCNILYWKIWTITRIMSHSRHDWRFHDKTNSRYGVKDITGSVDGGH